MEIIFAAISLVVGLTGGAIGAYIGMKVGLTRLETWRELIAPAIERVEKTVAIHGDDLLAHDIEIGTLMERGGFQRIRRQRIRD